MKRSYSTVWTRALLGTLRKTAATRPQRGCKSSFSVLGFVPEVVEIQQPSVQAKVIEKGDLLQL